MNTSEVLGEGFRPHLTLSGLEKLTIGCLHSLDSLDMPIPGWSALALASSVPMVAQHLILASYRNNGLPISWEIIDCQRNFRSEAWSLVALVSR